MLVDMYLFLARKKSIAFYYIKSSTMGKIPFSKGNKHFLKIKVVFSSKNIACLTILTILQIIFVDLSSTSLSQVCFPSKYRFSRPVIL